MQLMTEEELVAELDVAEHDIFRLETLEYYDVESERDYADYTVGAPGPDLQMREAWLDSLRRRAARGLRRRQVHILRSPVRPGSYLAYECEWGYIPNSAAGMQIGILDLAQTSLPAVLLGKDDFFVRDLEAVILMHYDRDCRFLGPSPAPRSHAASYLEAAEAAWEAAVPFADWWAAHRRLAGRPSTTRGPAS